jgi:hypothetical protein
VTLASDLYGEGKNASTLEEALAFVGPMLKDPLISRAYAEAGRKALICRASIRVTTRDNQDDKFLMG